MTSALVIGSSASYSLEQTYARALRHLGIAVTLFDPEVSVRRFRSVRLLNRLSWPFQREFIGRSLSRFFDQPPVYDLVIVFKGMFLQPEVLASCKRLTRGAQWININPDNPFDLGRSTSSAAVRMSIPLFDHYFIWSRALIPSIVQAGGRRVHYLAFGHDSVHFPTVQLDSSLAGTITFVGSYDPRRARTLEALHGYDLRIYGTAWGRLPRSSSLRRKVVSDAIFGADLRRVITSSLASINILRPQNAGSHNMRTFEVPAMGGVMLTSRSEEQQQFFPDGHASLMYSSPTELRAKVERLVSGEVDVQAIRQQALARSVGHSYTDRAREVLAAIGIAMDHAKK